MGFLTVNYKMKYIYQELHFEGVIICVELRERKRDGQRAL